MALWLVQITSTDPELLPFLVKSQQGNWCTFREQDGSYYLCSPEFETLSTAIEVAQRADGLLSTLNGIIKHEFHATGNLQRRGDVIRVDDQGRRITTTTTKDIACRAGLRADFFVEDTTQSLPFVQRLALAGNDPQIREAMRHYANETNWFNLYKVFEVIKIESKNKSLTLSLLADVRARKFTYSADNANASGDTARHPSAKFPNPSPKLNMTLGEAQQYITELLTQWLEAKK